MGFVFLAAGEVLARLDVKKSLKGTKVHEKLKFILKDSHVKFLKVWDSLISYNLT